MLQNIIPIKWMLLYASADAEQSATHRFLLLLLYSYHSYDNLQQRGLSIVFDEASDIQ